MESERVYMEMFDIFIPFNLYNAIHEYLINILLKLDSVKCFLNKSYQNKQKESCEVVIGEN